jgi:DNA processing protein
MNLKSLMPEITKETFDIMRLIRTERVGIKTFQNLIALYKTPQKALEAIPELAAKGGSLKNIKPCSIGDVNAEIEKIHNFGAEIICYQDKIYPKLLTQISDFPPILTIKGNHELLQNKSLAIVGSRNASLNGCKLAQKLASELGENSIIIVSGLARGIDTYAHIGSLTTGTIAVIAGSIDHIYPRENENLYHKITEDGLIISETPFGTAPTSQNFPQRNRIISGISYGTLIAEATLKSGSLITARFALEQNREVFAIPGFPVDSRYAGNNYLLKNGAILVENSNDILQVLNDIKEPNWLNDKPIDHYMIANQHFSEAEIAEVRVIIKNNLSHTPIKIEEIIESNNFPVNIVLTVILELELAGKIIRHPGNYISMIF